MEIFEPIGRAAKKAVNAVSPAIKQISPSFASGENYGPVSVDDAEAYPPADRVAFNYQMNTILGVAVLLGMLVAGATTAFVMSKTGKRIRSGVVRRARSGASRVRARAKTTYRRAKYAGYRYRTRAKR
jgi:hypothetical protein